MKTIWSADLNHMDRQRDRIFFIVLIQNSLLFKFTYRCQGIPECSVTRVIIETCVVIVLQLEHLLSLIHMYDIDVQFWHLLSLV